MELSLEHPVTVPYPIVGLDSSSYTEIGVMVYIHFTIDYKYDNIGRGGGRVLYKVLKIEAQLLFPSYMSNE